MEGYGAEETVKGELGGAALVPIAAAISGVQSRPCQSMQCGGASHLPSHQTSPSSVSATLVKIVLKRSVCIAFGLVRAPLPGATPKKPASGCRAASLPAGPGRRQ